ncbi:jg9686 [Pararge aegeria aegeria]|uniref:Jg9686 protein n=1 Tax=Pararge aegeria aegeria TaxID=348720 RepID=A0A8S4RRE7_9NEOP|nr:jg9686 [Pararge aegeria aegeria]
MSKWVGYAVSVSCGEPLGCYQGTILEADGNTITLNKAFRNGFPYPKSQVTLNAADIKDLKIIEVNQPSAVEQSHSTVAVSKNNKKGQRATVCENLQANPSQTNTARALYQ